MKKALKIALFAFLGILLLFVLFIGSIYIVLNTKIMDKKVIPFVLEKVERSSGIKVRIDETKIRLFSSVYLKGVSISLPDKRGLKGRADIEAVEILFSLKELWKGRFFVKSVEIIGPDVNVDLTASLLKDNEGSKQSSSMAELIGSVTSVLPYPAVNAAVFASDVRLTLRENDSDLAVEWFEEDIYFKLGLAKGVNDFSISSKLKAGGSKSSIRLSYGDYDAGALYSVELNARGKSLKVKEGYTLDFPSLNADFNLSDIKIRKKGQEAAYFRDMEGHLSALLENKLFLFRDKTDRPPSGIMGSKENPSADLERVSPETDGKGFTNKLSVSGNIFADTVNVLSFKCDIFDEPQELSGRINSTLLYDKKLVRFLQKLPDAEMIDRVTVNGTLDFALPHEAVGILEVKDFEALKADAAFKTDTAVSAWITEPETLFGIPVKDIPVRAGQWEVKYSADVSMPLKKLSFDFESSNAQRDVAFKVKGFTSFDLNTAIFDGSLHLRPFYPEGGTRTARGSFSLPFKINSLGKRAFDLTGVITFDELSFSNSLMEAIDVHGIVPLTEKIRLLENNKIAFTYVHTENPFNRADYAAIKPYSDDANLFTLKIGALTKGGITLGPVLADFYIEQNMIKAEHLRLKLFDGDLEGRFFMNVAKNAEEVGLLGMFSRIDPSKIAKSAGHGDDSVKYLSGQIEAVYNINSSDVTGRMDINEIGRSQLLTVADVLDPERKNSNLNMMRGALKFAYPTYVGVIMERGFFDLKMQVPALRLIKGSGMIHLRGLPLAPIVAMYSRDIKDMLERSPLE